MLRRLEDIPNLQVAEGSPDIRGWSVIDRDRGVVGKVDGLIVETDERSPDGLMPVRYMTVASRNRTFMVPIGLLDLREDAHEVQLRASAADFDRMPDYRREETTPERERHYFSSIFPHEQEPNYQRPEFEHRSERLKRLVGHYRDERQQQAQAKGHEETVELRRGDVEIERRPVNKPLAETAYQETGGRAIEDEGTIRMPVIGEQTVVHKVPYVQEEVILHTKDQTVRETVRKQEAEFVASEPTEEERTRQQGRRDREDQPSLTERLRRKLDRE